MRTPLTIDDEVLAAATDLANRQRKGVGEVVSALARQALQRPITDQTVRGGVPLLAARPGAPSVTRELVNQLRDELP